MNYQQACEQARIESYKHHCVQHVSCTIAELNSPAQGGTAHYVPSVGYYVSDWYDGTTVATYLDGRKTR